MKNFIFIIFTLLLFSCNPKENATSEDPKVTTTPENIKETLKAVVEGETYAYMEKDYEKWASYWDHSSEVLRLDIANGNFSQSRGWDKNGGNLESFFKENPEPITSTFVNSNYLIFHDINLAWVAFDQTWTSQTGKKSVAKATITLVKKASDWKIISYTAIQYEADDGTVDTLGRE